MIPGLLLQEGVTANANHAEQSNQIIALLTEIRDLLKPPVGGNYHSNARPVVVTDVTDEWHSEHLERRPEAKRVTIGQEFASTVAAAQHLALSGPAITSAIARGAATGGVTFQYLDKVRA